MNGLYKVAPAVAEKIPHARDVIGFRNILAHGYAEVDHNKFGLQVESGYDIMATAKEKSAHESPGNQETVLTTSRFEGGKLREVRLYPVDPRRCR